MDSCRIYKRATRIECSYLAVRLLLRAEKKNHLEHNHTSNTTDTSEHVLRYGFLVLQSDTRPEQSVRTYQYRLCCQRYLWISTNQILSRVFLPIVLRIFTSLRMMTDFTTLFLFSTQTRLGLAVSTSMKVFSLICTLVLYLSLYPSIDLSTTHSSEIERHTHTQHMYRYGNNNEPSPIFKFEVDQDRPTMTISSPDMRSDLASDPHYTNLQIFRVVFETDDHTIRDFNLSDVNSSSSTMFDVVNLSRVDNHRFQAYVVRNGCARIFHSIQHSHTHTRIHRYNIRTLRI